MRVQEILVELMLALDWNAGQDLASRLHGLYDYLYRRLVDANVKHDAGIIQEGIELLTTLREGWSEAYRQLAINGEQPQNETRPSKINLEG